MVDATQANLDAGLGRLKQVKQLQAQEKRGFQIHETFQETVQGEGYWAGALVDFIRLWGCPVGCPWCDTGYSPSNEGGKHIPREVKSWPELQQELRSPRVVISGGEPFMCRELPWLINAIQFSGREVSVETSGAKWQFISGRAWVTLSPKQHVSSNYPVEPLFWGRANEVKLVVADGSEIEFYRDQLEQYQQSGHGHIFFQPEWNARERTIPLCLEALRQFPGARLSLQTHKLIGVQ